MKTWNKRSRQGIISVKPKFKKHDKRNRKTEDGPKRKPNAKNSVQKHSKLTNNEFKNHNGGKRSRLYNDRCLNEQKLDTDEGEWYSETYRQTRIHIIQIRYSVVLLQIATQKSSLQGTFNEPSKWFLDYLLDGFDGKKELGKREGSGGTRSLRTTQYADNVFINVQTILACRRNTVVYVQETEFNIKQTNQIQFLFGFGYNSFAHATVLWIDNVAFTRQYTRAIARNNDVRWLSGLWKLIAFRQRYNHRRWPNAGQYASINSS